MNWTLQHLLRLENDGRLDECDQNLKNNFETLDSSGRDALERDCFFGFQLLLKCLPKNEGDEFQVLCFPKLLELFKIISK